MAEIIIFHGSSVEVSKPRILQNGFYKDFGYGFYCTKYENQAKRWALTRKGKSIVNRYIFYCDILLKNVDSIIIFQNREIQLKFK